MVIEGKYCGKYCTRISHWGTMSQFKWTNVPYLCYQIISRGYSCRLYFLHYLDPIYFGGLIPVKRQGNELMLEIKQPWHPLPLASCLTTVYCFMHKPYISVLLLICYFRKASLRLNYLRESWTFTEKSH